MEKQLDDFEAVRNVVKALEGFKVEDQERIIRWAKEKIGIKTTEVIQSPPSPSSNIIPQLQYSNKVMDIRAFVDSKNPVSDNQFAATIAYYYRFESPEAERKEAITAEDLVDACRKVGRARPKKAPQTLINAHNVGLLDKAGSGSYALNAVGENLVAMALPAGKEVPLKRKLAKKTAKTKARNSKGSKK